MKNIYGSGVTVQDRSSISARKTRSPPDFDRRMVARPFTGMDSGYGRPILNAGARRKANFTLNRKIPVFTRSPGPINGLIPK